MKQLVIGQLMLILMMSSIALAESEVQIETDQLNSQPTTWNSFDVTSGMTAGAAILSVLISIIAVFVAGKASSTNKKMFKRQGVIDLHMAWFGVNEIDPANLITQDVVRAIGALDLTAALWNHDVIEKDILYQSYWFPYKQLYDVLNRCNAIPPDTTRTCANLITQPISLAYESMKKHGLKIVGTSRV